MKKGTPAAALNKDSRKKDGIKNPGRREFLAKSARTGILLFLGILIGKLSAGKKISLSGNDCCINNSICARCRISNNCILPQAQSYREAKGRTGKA